MLALEPHEQRSARVPLEQFPPRDWLRRWKNRLGLVLPLLALGAFLLSFLRPDGGQTLTTPRAPVASVHASWDANCTACHEPFTPIQSASWTAPLFSHRPVTNEKCQTCHSGPIHHATQTSQGNCTDCHREHRGRQASLVRIPDSDCTVCHNNLANHYTGPNLNYANVSGFSAHGHPEFAWIKNKLRDPGNLRFHHKLHLTAGLPGADGSLRLLKLNDLAPKDRERYQNQQTDRRPDAPVQLSCASCHVTDAGDFGLPRNYFLELPSSALLPVRQSGDRMLPITYENQCRACHPLTFEPKEGQSGKEGRFRGDGHAVPHRLSPRKVRDYLEGFYAQWVLHNKADAFKQFIPTRPFPGKLLEEAPAKELRTLIKTKVEAAGMALFRSKQSCGLCHLAEDTETKPGPFPKAMLPTNVPDVWLTHAMFSHKAHRAVNCLHCHAAAPTSDKAADVLLPGVQNCLQCHGPQRVQAGVLVGGARWDCVECHRYHHGENPLQGLGAARRGLPLEKRLSPQELLSGHWKR